MYFTCTITRESAATLTHQIVLLRCCCQHLWWSYMKVSIIVTKKVTICIGSTHSQVSSQTQSLSFYLRKKLDLSICVNMRIFIVNGFKVMIMPPDSVSMVLHSWPMTMVCPWTLPLIAFKTTNLFVQIIPPSTLF